MWINTPNARLAIAARRGLRLQGRLRRQAAGRAGHAVGHHRQRPARHRAPTRVSFVVDSEQPAGQMSLGDCATVDVKSAAHQAARAAGSCCTVCGHVAPRVPVAHAAAVRPA